MNKKEEIILIAARLFHLYGYHNVGVQKILDKAGIPKGSFYHYFRSKDDLGLQVIALHKKFTQELLNSSPNDMEGLKSFFNSFFTMLKDNQYDGGCPIGNLILEMGDLNEHFRKELNEWFTIVEKGIEAKLMVHADELSQSPKELAEFLVPYFEGIIMKAKLTKNDVPLNQFNHFVFNTLVHIKHLQHEHS